MSGIVPRTRLLVFTALCVLPFAVVVGAVPGPGAAVSVMCLAAALVVVLIDALLVLGRLDGIHAELPDIVRLTKDREGVIGVRIANETRKRARLRLGLPLPRWFESPHDALETVLPADTAHSILPWRCTAVRRGRYALDGVYLEAPSPLGMWAVRGVSRIQTEIRVYPNLMTDRKRLAALFLNRGGFGIHAQRQVGKGREFEQLREYIPGDSYDEIHWKATAKRSRPVTKIFQIERTQEVYVIVDASRLSARPPSGVIPPAGNGNRPPETQLERFIIAALIMGQAAERQGDHFGVLVFSDRIEQFVRAGNGKAHYGVCRDAVYTIQPRVVNPDFDEMSAFVRLRLRRRALLVFLTGLDDPVLAESFVRNMELICRRHLILVNMLAPPGSQPLFSGERVANADDIYRRLAGHVQWHDLRELDRVLHRRGVAFSLLENEKLCVQLVSQYITVKQRQLL